MEEVKFPPFEDILVIGKNGPYGKFGLFKSFEILVPNEFEIISVEDKNVETVLINKKLLKKLPQNELVGILKEHIFPHISESEVVKVDLNLKIITDSIEIIQKYDH